MRADVANAIIENNIWDGTLDQERELYHIDSAPDGYNYRAPLSSEGFQLLSALANTAIPQDEYDLIYEEPSRPYLDGNEDRSIKLVSKNNPNRIYAVYRLQDLTTSVFNIGESELFRGGHIGDEARTFGGISYGRIGNINFVLEYNMNTQRDFQMGKKDYLRLYGLTGGKKILVAGFEF
jgi:hypothetical protein